MRAADSGETLALHAQIAHITEKISVRASISSSYNSIPALFRGQSYGRVPLFVTRQRVGRKRAPLRRPSGSLAASLSLGHGPREHPCSPALDFPSRKIHPAQAHPLGAAKGGWGEEQDEEQ